MMRKENNSVDDLKNSDIENLSNFHDVLKYKLVSFTENFFIKQEFLFLRKNETLTTPSRIILIISPLKNIQLLKSLSKWYNDGNLKKILGVR